MHAQPNLLSASIQQGPFISRFREHIVSKRETDAGAATYVRSYVCFALAGTWNYGVVTGSQWRETTGDELVIKTDTGAVIIPLSDPTLIVLTLTGYALRPFAALPLASHSVATVQTDTATIVDYFLVHGRHAALDCAALDLLSAHLSSPPASDMLFPCIFLDGTQCEVSVTHILDVAHATFQRRRREDTRALRRPIAGVVRPRGVDDTAERERPTKLIRSTYQTSDAGTLTTADVPDLGRTRVSAMLQTTTMLATIFDHYGGFPPFVFVRKEMKMAWDLLRVNFTLPESGDGGAFAALQGASKKDNVMGVSTPHVMPPVSWLPLLVTGSPGVGKSVLLVLFCAYLGVYHDFNILLVRAVTTADAEGVAGTDAVIWFRGGHVTQYPDFDRQNLSDLRRIFREESRADGRKHLFVGDGYLESDIRHSCPVVRLCNIISTSAQYRIKDDDTRAHAADEEILRTFEGRYALSGGSLRVFLKSTESQQTDIALHLTSTAIEAFATGNNAAPNSLIDSIRRTYIQDIDVYEHYMHVKHCRRIVDARVVQRFWIPKASVQYFEEMLWWVETTANASLHESLFQALLHKLAYDGQLELVLTRCDISTMETLDLAILPRTVDIQSPRDDTTDDIVAKQSCMTFLRTDLTDGVYWAPNHMVFPGVDAIVAQDQCVYYLHMAVTPVHSLRWDTITEVLLAVESNPRLAALNTCM